MSTNNPEPQGQDWPIYPGTPGSDRGSSAPNQFSEPVEERYSQDDAYKAYQSYVHPQPTDHRQLGARFPEPVEGRQPTRPTSSSALQKKYVWIAIGIVAAVVLTSIARGGFNLWPLIIFGAIAWWIVGNKRKC